MSEGRCNLQEWPRHELYLRNKRESVKNRACSTAAIASSTVSKEKVSCFVGTVSRLLCLHILKNWILNLLRDLANFNYLFISHEHSFAVSSILKAVAVICLLWS